MRIHQHDYRPAAGPHPPGTTTSAVIGGAAFTGLIPANDPVVQGGFLILGSITLPLRWLPADNQSAYYTVSVDSTIRADRFMDLLLLDSTGTTVLISHDHDGFTNYFIDEPSTTQGLGGILGSNGGRTQARSVTDSLIRLSGGPFVLEPGQGNLLFTYSSDSAGTPSLGLDYWPRWWFDRADDLTASGVAGAPPPRAWLNGRPLPGPPPPARVLLAQEAGQ